MKYQFNLGNDELVTIDKDKVEEFTTNNPEAKFDSFIDEEASGNTDPSPEKKDAPVEDKDMASRLDSGSLVYQESDIGDLVNRIQDAEKEGEANAGNILSKVPVDVWLNGGNTMLVWHLRVTAKGLMPVKPQLHFMKSAALAGGRALHLCAP